MISKELLKRLYLKENKTQREISKILNVSQSTISNKIKEYKIYKKGDKNKFNNNIWKDNQIDYVIINYGKKSYEEIGNSKIIQKTADAVRQMAQTVLKLGDPKEYDECLTKTTLLKRINISDSLMNKYIKKYGLPAIKRKIAFKREYNLIKISDFWKWAEKYKDIIYWNKFKEGVLGTEPKWTIEARRKFRETKPLNHGLNYTNEDDKYIMSAYKAGISIKSIAETLKRGEWSINRRITFINAERTRNINWTDEKKAELIKLSKEGFTINEISKKMNIDYGKIKAARERYITNKLKK